MYRHKLTDSHSIADAGSGSYGSMLANVSQQLVEASVAKIVAWTSDIRSVEVRRASQDALYALFSLHPGEVTRILSSLPKVCQVMPASVYYQTRETNLFFIEFATG